MGIIMIAIILTFKRLGIIYCDNTSDNRSVLENSEVNTKKIKWIYD